MCQIENSSKYNVISYAFHAAINKGALICIYKLYISAMGASSWHLVACKRLLTNPGWFHNSGYISAMIDVYNNWWHSHFHVDIVVWGIVSWSRLVWLCSVEAMNFIGWTSLVEVLRVYGGWLFCYILLHALESLVQLYETGGTKWVLTILKMLSSQWSHKS